MSFDSLPDRVLHREWKTLKPYLPKSSSLPAFQLAPRGRPRFICVRCGFVNFYNIPMCVWCATRAPEASVRAFERTIPRTRTSSAPPRVFWKPNELCLSKRDSHHHKLRRPHTVGLPPRVQGHHKRSHSQPNAVRLGHPTRPYYSVIRHNTRPPPITIPPPLSNHYAIPIEGDSDSDSALDVAPTFSFVSPDAPVFTTLSARISRTLASPVLALYAMSKAAEMRDELAALVRAASIEASDRPEEFQDGILVKIRRSLRGLVRRH
ncbi:hypothetical protein FB45DRAFT_997690 [Roridomyces roridus]|uniref:Uncharacterized protein n=1 Tax=Roridomyces roridus TaxID=1738132 RepID=A0AAD7CK72_9AGAR|nr:hypothetical protein FB45DRAFT_997690 [Roridomyces roridus]